MVALDLTAAFDTVNHHHLLNYIASSDLSNNTKRRILAYLRGRLTYLEFSDTKSKRRKVKQGAHKVVCYNRSYLISMSKMPLPEYDIIKVTTYADDITLTTPGPNIDTLADNINPYLNSLNTWLTYQKISPQHQFFQHGRMNLI